MRDIFSILIKEAHHLKVRPNLDDVCATKSKYSHEAIRKIGTPKIDAVVAIARQYHGKIPLAVASSGNREHVLATLRANGIIDLFDHIVTCEDIANPKPAPDIFLLAAHRIGCDPSKCRGFEDADIGMAALRAAGMEAIDVRHMKGYPTVVPSTMSVLLMDDEVAVENIDDGATTSSNSANGGASKGKKPIVQEADNSMGLFFRQALFTAVAAYFVYLLMNRLMFEAVRDEAWDAD